MKSGKLIIHPGPPKTATTSLQHFFQSLEHPYFKYLGIHQPRHFSDNSIAKKVYEEIVGKKGKHRQSVIDYIASLLAQGTSVIMSEEMLLVEGVKIGWKQKMINLFDYFKELSPELLITVRNPINAIPSYYQEMYYKVDSSKIRDINAFAQSEYCQIYRFLSLHQLLKDIGYCKVHYFLFEELLNDQIRINRIFDLEEEIIIRLDNKNNSPRNTQGRYAKNSSFKKYLRHEISRRGEHPYIRNLIYNQFTRRIYHMIPNFPMIKGHYIDEIMDEAIISVFEKEHLTFIEDNNNKNINFTS